MRMCARRSWSIIPRDFTDSKPEPSLLGRRYALASRIPDEAQILNHLGRHAKLFGELLIRQPLEADFAEHEGLRVELWIIDGHGELQIVVVHAGVALLHVSLDGVRISGAVEPGFVIQTGAIHHKRVVVHPFAD